MKRMFLVVPVLLCVLFPKISFSLTEQGYKQLHSFAQVLHQIEENYVEEINEKEIVMGAIRGMLMTLDPHTVYMSPAVYKELKAEATGRFGGVGIEVTLRKNWLTVVAPIEGSPAFKAGLKAGDKIVRINGVSTKGYNLSEAVAMMRGRVGRGLTLTLVRAKVKKPFDVYLERQVIKVPSISIEELGDGYVYARISTFQERTSLELGEKLKKITTKAGPINGLIIDLRNNPGGLLSQAIEVSDLFLDKGVIVSTRSRDKVIAKFDATESKAEPDYPIVVLVNGGSASASEILGGALKDYNRAVLVGTQTFGKGSVQSVIELDDGAAIKITVAKYYTPSGISIQGFGIPPNVVIEELEENGEIKDVQRAKAIEIVKSKALYKKALKSKQRYMR